MTAERPPGEQAGTATASGGGPDAGSTPPPASSAVARANRLSAANMARSLLPLVVVVLVVVGYVSLRQPDEPVRTVDPAPTVQLARARADYPVPAPTGLPAGYRPTYARTDAGQVTAQGGPVTVEIGYVTPGGGFAGFAVSDDPRAAPLRAVLDGAQEQGTTPVAGQQWQRLRSARGETVLSRQFPGEATVTVTGSATEAELTEVAGAVRTAG